MALRSPLGQEPTRIRRVALVIATILVGGCSAILNIGDLPGPGGSAEGPDGASTDAPNGSDGGVDASDGSTVSDASDAGADVVTPTCDGGSSPCGASCVDLQSSAANCGTCGHACPSVTGATSTCETAVCKLDSDESVQKAWSFTAPGPYLSFWKDGTLVASSGGSTVLITTGVAPAKTDFSTLPGRQTVVVPNVVTRPEVVLSHYGSFDGRIEIDGGLAWSNGIHGCCGSGPDGFGVDPVLGRLFTGHGVTELSTDDGTTVSATSTFDQHGSSFFVTSTALYLPRLGTPKVDKYDRNHALQWTLLMGPAGTSNVAAGALASDGGIIVTSSAGNYLTRMKPLGSKAWEVPVTAPGAPITTSTGLVVLGATKLGLANLCAFDFATGDEKWCTPTDADVVEVLSGDDGILYTSVASTPTVYGYDRVTGALRSTFRNLPAPEEMLLRAGRLYVYGGGTVTAIDVPATKYDASSWPVRFHDNQRTRGTVSTLDY